MTGDRNHLLSAIAAYGKTMVFQLGDDEMVTALDGCANRWRMTLAELADLEAEIGEDIETEVVR